jgi:hypothetical protein
MHSWLVVFDSSLTFYQTPNVHQHMMMMSSNPSNGQRQIERDRERERVVCTTYNDVEVLDIQFINWPTLSDDVALGCTERGGVEAGTDLLALVYNVAAPLPTADERVDSVGIDDDNGALESVIVVVVMVVVVLLALVLDVDSSATDVEMLLAVELNAAEILPERAGQSNQSDAAIPSRGAVFGSSIGGADGAANARPERGDEAS